MSEHGLYDHGYDIHQMGWGNKDGGEKEDASSSSSSVSSSGSGDERISVRRRKRQHNKEEALYGVFSTHPPDTETRSRTRTSRNKKQFSSGTVAFVKATAKQDTTTTTTIPDDKDARMMDVTATPTTTTTMTTLEQEEWDELAESELNAHAMNAKFTQLLERSTTSTIPITTPLEPIPSKSTTTRQPILEETTKQQQQLQDATNENENEDAFEEYRNQQKKNKSGFGLGYKPSSSASFPSSTNNTDSISKIDETIKKEDSITTAMAAASVGVKTTQSRAERTTLPEDTGNGTKLLEQADLASFFTSAQSSQPPSNHRRQYPTTKNAPKKDPNLGTWEKHTKGIGYKLLIKMGYEGSGGLGSKRRRRLSTTPTTATTTATTTPMTTASNHENAADAKSTKKGISRPVEVVVRPANLGLGFGNFTEATQLKGNRQIEAEVRGIDWKKQEQEQQQQQQEERKRLLPTTRDLLAHATDWKKQPHANKKRRKEKRHIISYQELVKEEEEAKNATKLHIIDMRGPTSFSTVPSLNADGTVPLGEELLHNVTLLLNTMENQLLSTSHLARSTKQRVASLQSDVHAMTQRIQDGAHRRTKLQTVLQIMDDIDTLQTQTSNHDHDDDKDHITVMTQVQKYIQKLHDNFTKEEKESLHFYNVLVPCLLGPFVEKHVVQWDPLGSSPLEHDQMMTSVWNLSPSPLTGQIVPSTGDESKWFTRRSIFVNHILPRAKRALQSSQWDPMSTVDDGLELYEAMLKGAAMACPPPMVSQSREEKEDVLLEAPMEQLYTSVDTVKEELMHETIYPKMSRSISAWKPVMDKKQQSLGECRLVNPLHLWVLPWLPHLDHKTILPTLLGDIKRKLRSSLSYLQGAKGVHERDFLSASFGILEPWRGILENKTLQDLTSNSVVPRLDKYLCNMVVSRESKDQDWSSVDILFKWHAAGLLADRELMSLVEGEVLCTWARALHAWLSLEESSEPTANVEQMSEFYADWKQKLLLNTQHGEEVEGPNVVPACQLLRKDKMICQHFYACLLMIQSKMDDDADALDDLLPPFRESYNYRHAMVRRVRDERIKEQEKEVLQHGTVPAPRHFHKSQQHTFREVVEDYAREQNVSFTPRLGANSTKDGKPIFMFGATPIYIDSNVVFALRESKWQPTSLESLS